MNIKITNILNNFLRTQGYPEDEIYAEYRENENSYYDESYSTSLIVLGGLTNKKADKVFMEFCKNDLGLKTKVSIITLSFLHELGHHNTTYLLDEEEIINSEFTKLMLSILGKETKEAFLEYFMCPSEIEATINAVEFCNNYPNVLNN